jgi:hypothetical protein
MNELPAGIQDFFQARLYLPVFFTPCPLKGVGVSRGKCSGFTEKKILMGCFLNFHLAQVYFHPKTLYLPKVL